MILRQWPGLQPVHLYRFEEYTAGKEPEGIARLAQGQP